MIVYRMSIKKELNCITKTEQASRNVTGNISEESSSTITIYVSIGMTHVFNIFLCL